MPTALHTGTTYKLTDLETSAVVFETTVGGDIDKVVMPTEKLKDNHKYRLDVLFKTDDGTITVNTPDGQLASVEFTSTPLIKKEGIDLLEWRKHKYGSSTLLECVTSQNGLQNEELNKDDYKKIVEQTLKSIDSTFLKLPAAPQDSSISSDKQNIIVMPIILADGKATLSKTILRPGPVESPGNEGQVPPPLPFDQLPPKVARNKSYWRIVKPDTSIANGGITNPLKHDGKVMVAEYKVLNSYPGNHDATDWEVSLDEGFNNVEFRTSDEQYRKQLNVNVNKPGVWVYVRYRFRSNYAGQPLVSDWSDTLKFRTTWYGVKPFTITMSNSLKPKITTSGFLTENSELSGPVNHTSTTYRIHKVEDNSELFKLANSATDLTETTITNELPGNTKVKVIVTYHADNAKVEDRTVEYIWTTPVKLIEKPQVTLEYSDNNDVIKVKVTNPFKIENSEETHKSTTWKLMDTSMSGIAESAKDTVNLMEYDVTSAVASNTRYYLDVTFHSDTVNSETTRVFLHAKTFTTGTPNKADVKIVEEADGLHKIVVSNPHTTFATKKLASLKLELFRYDDSAPINAFTKTFTTEVVDKSISELTDGKFEYKLTKDDMTAIKNKAPNNNNTAWAAYYQVKVTLTFKPSGTLVLPYYFGKLPLKLTVGGVDLITDGSTYSFKLKDVNYHGATWNKINKVNFYIVSADGNTYLGASPAKSNENESWDFTSLVTAGTVKLGKWHNVLTVIETEYGLRVCADSNYADPDYAYRERGGTRFLIPDLKIEAPYADLLAIKRHNQEQIDVTLRVHDLVVTGNDFNETITHKYNAIKIIDITKVKDGSGGSEVDIFEANLPVRHDYIFNKPDVSSPTFTADPTNVNFKFNGWYRVEVTQVTDKPGFNSPVTTFEFKIPDRPKAFINPPVITKAELKQEGSDISYTMELDGSKFFVNKLKEQTHQSTKWKLYVNGGTTPIFEVEKTDEEGKYKLTIDKNTAGAPTLEKGKFYYLEATYTDPGAHEGKANGAVRIIDATESKARTSENSAANMRLVYITDRAMKFVLFPKTGNYKPEEIKFTVASGGLRPAWVKYVNSTTIPDTTVTENSGTVTVVKTVNEFEYELDGILPETNYQCTISTKMENSPASHNTMYTTESCDSMDTDDISAYYKDVDVNTALSVSTQSVVFTNNKFAPTSSTHGSWKTFIKYTGSNAYDRIITAYYTIDNEFGQPIFGQRNAVQSAADTYSILTDGAAPRTDILECIYLTIRLRWGTSDLFTLPITRRIEIPAFDPTLLKNAVTLGLTSNNVFGSGTLSVIETDNGYWQLKATDDRSIGMKIESRYLPFIDHMIVEVKETPQTGSDAIYVRRKIPKHAVNYKDGGFMVVQSYHSSGWRSNDRYSCQQSINRYCYGIKWFAVLKDGREIPLQ